MLSIPNTLVGQERVHISFHVEKESQILCCEPGMSAFIFSPAGTSGSENQSLSWRFRAIQATICQSGCYLFIVVMNLIRYFIISAHTATVLVRKIYIYFVLTEARNRKFPYANHISYD